MLVLIQCQEGNILGRDPSCGRSKVGGGRWQGEGLGNTIFSIMVISGIREDGGGGGSNIPGGTIYGGGGRERERISMECYASLPVDTYLKFRNRTQWNLSVNPVWSSSAF